MCAYEKVCTYKKGAPNNPSLRYYTQSRNAQLLLVYTIQYSSGDEHVLSAQQKSHQAKKPLIEERSLF